jgi:ribonucleoside-triphosphate reductase
MYTACNAGYINMIDLFSTIGINGLNEAARFLGIEVNYNEEYKEFCRLITGTISEQNKKHSTKKFKFNQEFVPAEGLSSKNYNWDKEGYWVPEDTKIYNSYFYNAWDPNTSVLDKFKLHGKEFTELLDGGVGLHCNLEEHLSKEQYLKMMDFAAQNGTSYYTYNIPNSECTNDECHYIVKNPMEKCPKCGSPMRLWTRVVGFLRPIDGYDAGRYWDAVNRVYHKNRTSQE